MEVINVKSDVTSLLSKNTISEEDHRINSQDDEPDKEGLEVHEDTPLTFLDENEDSSLNVEKRYVFFNTHKSEDD